MNSRQFEEAIAYLCCPRSSSARTAGWFSRTPPCSPAPAVSRKRPSAIRLDSASVALTPQGLEPVAIQSSLNALTWRFSVSAQAGLGAGFPADGNGFDLRFCGGRVTVAATYDLA